MWTREGAQVKPRWQSRQYESIAFTRDVENPHPRAGEFERGDIFVLYVDDDEAREDPVYVRLSDADRTGRMKGHIARQTRRGAHGDALLEQGATVEFDGQHIFRFEKAT
jgi:hypothetical protein